MSDLDRGVSSASKSNPDVLPGPDGFTLCICGHRRSLHEIGKGFEPCVLGDEPCDCVSFTVAPGGRKLRPGDQPLPVVNDSEDIQTAVIRDIEARREVGIERYGTPLQANNGRDAFRDAYEEALDLAMYLKQCIVERDTFPLQTVDDRAESERLADHGSSGGSEAPARAGTSLASGSPDESGADANFEAYMSSPTGELVPCPGCGSKAASASQRMLDGAAFPVCICGHAAQAHQLGVGFEKCAVCDCVSYARNNTPDTEDQRIKAFTDRRRAKRDALVDDKTAEPREKAEWCGICGVRLSGIPLACAVHGRDAAQDEPLPGANPFAHVCNKGKEGPMGALLCAVHKVHHRAEAADDASAEPDIRGLKRALSALTLEVPAAVYDDFAPRVQALIAAYNALWERSRDSASPGLVEAVRCAVDAFDLHPSDYSSVERAAIEKLHHALASHDGTSATGGNE